MLEGALWETAAAAGVFALVHVFVGRLKFLDVIPRSRWLSFAGGVSVGYVFLHVLPGLAAAVESVSGPGWASVPYGLALAGLVLFYGLERMMREEKRTRAPQDAPGGAVFWVHVAPYALFNGLVGYVVANRGDEGVLAVAAFTVGVGLHFLTNDYGMWLDHRHRYQHTARWVLAASVAGGWTVGAALRVPDAVTSLLFAFLAGGMILNVLKEELPEDRQSRFVPFLFGALLSAGLLGLAQA